MGTVDNMPRANAILSNPIFVRELERINDLEKDRIFCGHGMEHLLDVARIAHILNLESKDSLFPKELIYAAALLHDIGRARQYDDGTPHEIESARLSESILPKCGFSENESKLILDAILSHRTASRGEKSRFSEYLYRSDKLSRRCRDCAGFEQCDWKLKNMQLVY